MVERPDELADVVRLPPWLWSTWRVWTMVLGQWRTHGETLLSIDLLALRQVMEWQKVPVAEQLAMAERIQVIEGHVRRLSSKKASRQ